MDNPNNVHLSSSQRHSKTDTSGPAPRHSEVMCMMSFLSNDGKRASNRLPLLPRTSVKEKTATSNLFSTRAWLFHGDFSAKYGNFNAKPRFLPGMEWGTPQTKPNGLSHPDFQKGRICPVIFWSSSDLEQALGFTDFRYVCLYLYLWINRHKYVHIQMHHL